MMFGKQVEKIEVIRTTLSKKGKGVDGDPIRILTQFWSLDGDLLAEVDEWEEGEKIRRRSETLRNLMNGAQS